MGKHWANLQMHRSTTKLFSFLLSTPLVFIASNHILCLVFISWSSTSQAVSPMRASTYCLKIRDSLFFIARPSAIIYSSQPGMAVCRPTLSTSVQEAAKGPPEEFCLEEPEFQASSEIIFFSFYLHSLVRKENHDMFTLTILVSVTDACCLSLMMISIVWYLNQPWVLCFCSLIVFIIRDPLLVSLIVKNNVSQL